jgi:hypothetical protein
MDQISRHALPLPFLQSKAVSAPRNIIVSHSPCSGMCYLCSILQVFSSCLITRIGHDLQSCLRCTLCLSFRDASVKLLLHACSLRHLLNWCSCFNRLRFRPPFDSIVSYCPFLDHLPFFSWQHDVLLTVPPHFLGYVLRVVGQS